MTDVDLKEKSVAAVSRGKPDFMAITAGKAAVGGSFGLFGGIVMMGQMKSAGNQIVQENEIEDPANYISHELLDDLAIKRGLLAKEVKGVVTTSETTPNLCKRYRDVDVLLDVATTYWGFAYFPFDWNHYWVKYGVEFRLIDVKTGRILAEGSVIYQQPGKTSGAPTKDELLRNKAERLKQELHMAAGYCLAELRILVR